ncbi:MAG TPA: glycosyltransferase family 39 protein [Candidatus Saccharimonadales bacterium]|nr:glycosyltransferase family 39 protein [Candidatus Saccharimonadales bacterium]
MFFVIAGIIFLVGLKSPFIGDDFPQIVDNPQVHSLAHIPELFREGTFADIPGQAEQNSGGYRPLMMTAFSLLYSVFGAQPVVFHVFMLLIAVLNAFLLFLVFRYCMPQVLALGLALIFLAHPLNSQMVFSIPVTQDALFFLFGILGFWTILRFQDKSVWYLALSAALLLLSLLSKETGILFVIMALVYTCIATRKRFYVLLALSAVVLAVYIPLKLHAVGLGYSAGNAPIEGLALAQRLLHVPELVMFYITRFAFPLDLAQAYYWTHSDITLRHFVVPLIFDVSVLSVLAYAGHRIRHEDMKLFVMYVFFACWLLVGLGAHLHIVPLDMTASETWFYFPMVGLLGMAGAAGVALIPRTYWVRCGYILTAVVCLLAVRTFVRGFDWQSQTRLAYSNIAVSKEDYISYNLIANDFLRRGEYAQAKEYATQSVALHPFGTNYNTLASAELYAGNYAAAQDGFIKAIRYGGDSLQVYQNLGLLYAVYDGDTDSAKAFYSTAVAKFPHDATLWFYAAVFANNQGYDTTAKQAISRAHTLGDTDQEAYVKIISGQPYTFTLGKVR